MSRKSRRYARRRSYEYDDYYSPHSYRRHGCWGSIQHFFHTVALTMLVIAGSVAFGLVVLLIVFHFALVLQILTYVLYVAIGLAILGVVYVVVRIIAAIANLISHASVNRSKAKQEQERWHQAQVQVQKGGVEVQAQRVRLAQEHYAFQQRQFAQEFRTARPTRNLQQDSQLREWREQPLVRRLPVSPLQTEPELEPEGIPGMPAKGQIFRYRDYERRLAPGQLIAGIRADGTAHVASWDEFKILLILGSSASGKTTTIVEKCVCAVRSAGWLVICDPHAQKPDSLTRRILSLRYALMPGTTLAMEHQDIMANVHMVHEEFERRRRGADMQAPIFLVIEEVNRLMRDKAIAKELSAFCEEMGQEARGYNIFLILCAQRVSGLADIRNSMIACICHKVSPMESEKCLPARVAKYTGELGIGQTFVLDADGNVFPLQQVLVEEQDVAAIAQRLHRTMHSRQTEPAWSQPASPAEPPLPQQWPLPHPSVASTTQRKPGLRTPRLVQQAPPSQAPLAPKPAASPVWGEPLPAPRPTTRPIAPRLPTLPARPQEHMQATEDAAPRGVLSQPGKGNPFDALVALREQRHHKPTP